MATTSATETTEQPQDAGLLGSLGINGTMFTFQLINFAVVASIVWFLILKPLTKKMTERQKMIDESIDNAKKVQDNLQKSEQKYQQRIDEAKVEANKVLEKAAAETEQMVSGMKGKAKQEIELLVDQAKRNIKIEREDMSRGIKKEAAELVVSVVEKFLTEKVDDTKDKALVAEMVKKLSN